MRWPFTRQSGLLLLALLVLLAPFGSTAEPAPEDVLHKKTRQAEERVKKWDEENKRLDKRNRWEVPLASALILVGGALATRSQPYIYATSIAAGLGLGIHFWTHRHPPPPDANEPEEL